MSLQFLHERSVLLLRFAFGIVFVWTGILKLFNVSPVQDILTKALPGLGESQLLLFAAAFFEILIGIALLSNKFVKIASIILIVHMLIVTIAVLFTQGFAPRFPVLSLAGEHVLKNLVFIAGALILISEKEVKHHTPEKANQKE